MTALVEVLAAHQVSDHWGAQHDGWVACSCSVYPDAEVAYTPTHVAEAIAGAGLAVVELPPCEFNGVWRVSDDEDDFTVSRIALRELSDGTYTPGSRVHWDDDIEMHLSPSHARSLAAALLASVPVDGVTA